MIYKAEKGRDDTVCQKWLSIQDSLSYGLLHPGSIHRVLFFVLQTYSQVPFTESYSPTRSPILPIFLYFFYSPKVSASFYFSNTLNSLKTKSDKQKRKKKINKLMLSSKFMLHTWFSACYQNDKSW